MASDIKLHEHNVVVEGGELHSAGPAGGFSFADRTRGDAGRWVLYAQDGQLRLWSGRDIVKVVTRQGTGFADGTPILSCLGLSGWIFGLEAGAGGPFSGTGNNVFCIAEHLVLANPKAKAVGTPEIFLFNRALTHTEDDQLVINDRGGYSKGVRIDSNVQVKGAVTQASSIALKENVAQLSTQQALVALQGLNAVTFNYKADERKEQHVGFIAEDVPDLVAKSDHKAVSSMDVVAVLTKVVQEQQRTITELAARVDALQQGGR